MKRATTMTSWIETCRQVLYRSIAEARNLAWKRHHSLLMNKKVPLRWICQRLRSCRIGLTSHPSLESVANMKPLARLQTKWDYKGLSMIVLTPASITETRKKSLRECTCQTKKSQLNKPKCTYMTLSSKKATLTKVLQISILLLRRSVSSPPN